MPNDLDMPILAALTRHVRKSRYPLHVPGHKQGRALPGSLLQWLGAAAALDLTELPGLDNFHEPEGCIARSQELAAAAYGSDQCWYSVNGSTACVMAALAAAAPGGRVLFLNPFHLSAWRGLVLADAEPVLVPVRWDAQQLTCLPPGAADVEAVLAQHPDVTAVFLTSPTYQGAVAPVAEIAQAVHQHGLPLIVDEAHGAHLGLHPALPPHSVAAGADLVVHSVHKLLPGLTQTAWLHRRGDRVPAGRIARMLRFLHSTSPSYLLLASLDAVQAWLRSEGPAAAARALEALAVLDELPGRGPATADFARGTMWDPFKHWLPTGSTVRSRAVADRLARHGLFVEYADALGVLSVFGLFAPPRMVALYVEQVREAIAAFSAEAPEAGESTAAACAPAWAGGRASQEVQADAIRALLEGLAQARLLLRPRQADKQPAERVPLALSAGRVSGEMVTPYPPGVPVLLPGQLIEPWHVEAIEALAAGGASVHGLADGQITVLRETAQGGASDGIHHV
jgi:arginine decarboxylase